MKGRKDVYDISPYVDRQATMANSSATKGKEPYAKNPELRKALKTVMAGAAAYGDRLHAAGFLKDDKCTCPECNQARHTAIHVYWECDRHKERRDKYTTDIEKQMNKAIRTVGPHARDHLQETIANAAFHNTGVCPDHMPLLDTTADFPTCERIPELKTMPDEIISGDTQGLTTIVIDGIEHVVVYTDGSLLDPHSEHFIRADGECILPRTTR